MTELLAVPGVRLASPALSPTEAGMSAVPYADWTRQELVAWLDWYRGQYWIQCARIRAAAAETPCRHE